MKRIYLSVALLSVFFFEYSIAATLYSADSLPQFQPRIALPSRMAFGLQVMCRL